jgi:hypothetical protein
MPSRAEVRGGIETVLRALSLAVLAWLLWLSLDRGQAESRVSGRSANLVSAVRDWSRIAIAPHRITVQLDKTPSPLERDWLRALNGAGSKVTWSGELPVTALSAQAIASPRGGFTILAAAPAAARVQLSDKIGTLDTATAKNGGARFSIPSASGVIHAATRGSTASATLPDSARVRRVLVIGNAGWESKFVVAALEEDGWKVDSEMRVAPGVSVTQGSLSPIDTSRYSAVIALDGSAASRASEITRYVASGGGLILAGSSAGLEAFSAIRPGLAGRTEAGSILESGPGSTTLASLPLTPVASLRGDAISLGRRGSSIATAARRHEAGRVLQQGYVDTWRWRMAGGEDSPSEHRAWWTHAVASVAYLPRSIDTDVSNEDNAPVARLIASLGPSSSAEVPGLVSTAGSVPVWILFTVLALSLLAEWASRRLRGFR